MLIKSDVAKALPLVILPHLALLVRGLTIPSANDTATQQVRERTTAVLNSSNFATSDISYLRNSKVAQMRACDLGFNLQHLQKRRRYIN